MMSTRERNAGRVAEDTTNQPLDYEPGAVLPVAGDPTAFYVLGDHEWWYLCRLPVNHAVATCECPDRKYRGAFCKHLRRVKEFVEQGKRQAADEAVEWFLGLSEEDRKAIWK